MRPIIGMTCSLTVSALGNTSYLLERNQIGLDYIRAVEHVGGTPIALPHIQGTACIDHYLDLIDGLLLPGGGDIDPLLYGQEPHEKMGNVDRLRDEIELQLARKALEQDLPILGICRGIQVLNVAAGGTLYQDIAAEVTHQTVCHTQKGAGWYASHTIDIQPDSHLHQIAGCTTMRVNSFHHQAVRQVGKGFVAIAHAKDGVIEAIESAAHRFVLGVEYHPELMWGRHPEALNLFAAFVKACK